jgi:hypothetical protein
VPHPETVHFTFPLKGTVSTVLPFASLRSRLAILCVHWPDGLKVTGTTSLSLGARIIEAVGTEK